MIRERALKILLVLVGLLFLAGIYPLLMMHPGPADQMLASIYIVLGVFLLLAVRNPPMHRSLISFTAWSSLAHGGVMAIQVFRDEIPRADLLRAVLPLAVIGVALIVFAPAKTRESSTQARFTSSAA